jgi:hypothetical protein
VRFEGLLIKKIYAKDSKSEREAVFLKLDDGRDFLLLRIGGNPYQDKELLVLLGKKVAIDGVIDAGKLFFYTVETLQD